jgi:hypothetical protein
MRQEIAAGVVEIIRMLIVAEQHSVDDANVVDRQGRTACLRQLNVRQLIVARRVKRRIGEEPETGDFNQHGWTADQGQDWG